MGPLKRFKNWVLENGISRKGFSLTKREEKGRALFKGTLGQEGKPIGLVKFPKRNWLLSFNFFSLRREKPRGPGREISHFFGKGRGGCGQNQIFPREFFFGTTLIRKLGLGH